MISPCIGLKPLMERLLRGQMEGEEVVKIFRYAQA